MENARAPIETGSYRGRLFIVEGGDGSGKSTQIQLLQKWLISRGYLVYFTEWNSSVLVKKSIKNAKKKNALTPITFSLIHACDFADRYEKLILPHLQAGYIVLCDRYKYTAYARDLARGCNREWVKNVYGFAAKPTAAFYFRAPLDVTIQRILSGRPQLKFHEAGMDMGWSSDPVESFRIFQGKIKENYDEMINDEEFIVIDATESIETQQAILRRIICEQLVGYDSPYNPLLDGFQRGEGNRGGVGSNMVAGYEIDDDEIDDDETDDDELEDDETDNDGKKDNEDTEGDDYER